MSVVQERAAAVQDKLADIDDECTESSKSARISESESKSLQQFVKSSPCLPHEHPLEFTYVFSYFVRPLGKFDPEEYALYVQSVATFCSVEQFWNTYTHLRRPSDAQEKVDFHFFKEGIKPVWEDAANCKGGKWILRLKKRFIVAHLGKSAIGNDRRAVSRWRRDLWRSLFGSQSGGHCFAMESNSRRSRHYESYSRHDASCSQSADKCHSRIQTA